MTLIRAIFLLLAGGISLGASAAGVATAPVTKKASPANSDFLTKRQKKSMIRAIRRAPVREMSPEEEEEAQVLNEHLPDMKPPPEASHGYDYSQVPDSPSLFQRILGAPRLPGTKGINFGSTEWSDTIDVIEYMRGTLKKTADQMAFKRPKAWKMLAEACQEGKAVTFLDEVVSWVKAKYPADVAEILLVGKPKEAKSCQMSAAALKAAHLYVDNKGQCRVRPKPMRATAFYLLDSLKDEPGLSFPPGMDPASFFALARTLVGEAQSLSCNSPESYQASLLREIHQSLSRKQKSGAKLSKVQQTLLDARPISTVSASRGSVPWWAEPCRKGNMEIITKAALNRAELTRRSVVREAAAAKKSSTPMREPASASKPTPYLLKEIIRHAAFSEWNEFDNPRQQGLPCLMTGGGNYANVNTTGSAMYALRNVLGNDKRGRPFLRASVPISNTFTSFAKSGYINQLDGNAARSSITLYEGPPPGDPNLGRVKFSGAVYGDREQGRFPDQLGHIHLSLTGNQ